MKKKTILFAVITAVLLCAIAIGVVAAVAFEKPREVMSYIVGITDEAPEYADANGDGEINVLDVIALLKGEKLRLYDADGEKLTASDNIIAIPVGTTYTLKAESSLYSADQMTWTTGDATVATVTSGGVVTVINPGEAKITVTTPDKKSCTAVFNVYESVSEQVTYRWDFNDLTENNHGNDLTLAGIAKSEGAEANYTLANGVYTVSKSAPNTERPYFNFKTPIVLNDKHDWSIEMKGYVYKGGNLFFGQDPIDPKSTTEEDGFIYVSPTTNWTPNASTPSYRVKFRADGKSIFFELGDKNTAFLSMATWRYEYVAANKAITLSLSTDDGATWTTVATTKTTTFSATFRSIFGASRGDGTYNFNGEMDYVEITCFKTEKVMAKDNLDVTYRWDFDDLTDSVGGNDLTLNTNTKDGVDTSKNYTISNGTYKVISGLTDYNKPDFDMKTPFTLSSTQDWAVQWKGNFKNTGTVIGQDGADNTLDKDTGGHIYISPGANWKGGVYPNPTYAVKFKYTSSKNVIFPYTPYLSVVKTMSTWRIEYDAETKTATLSFSQDDGATWTVASKTAMPTFSTQFTNVFGRTFQSGKYNFNSEMDYIQVSLGKADTTGGVALESLELDDNNYTLTYSKYRNDYTVYLPEGHPAVPRIKATAADGLTVEIQQAYIPEGETEGKAYAVVSDGKGKSATYTVTFVKTERAGFVLQYDDRYTFTPDYRLGDGESFTFESSNTAAITVDANGVMTAVSRTNTPVTVTAKVGDSVVDTLVIDRIEKAHINLFFITGQSNGQGCYDTVNYDGTTETEGNEWMIPYLDQLAAVEKIGGEGRVYSYDVHPRSENIKAGLPEAYNLYDMNNYQKQGHSAPIGRAYYDLTGEKVVFLQSAWSGAPIESWLDPDRYEEAGGYGLATRNFYQTTKDGYNKLMKLLSQNYEVVLKANFWCQGETAMSSYYDKSISNYIFSSNAAYDATKLITAEKYYEYFMRIDGDMRQDYGLDYNGIMFTKTKGAATDTVIVPIVSAYFGLVNNNENIFTATRKFIEIATQYKTGDPTKEGYGFMGTDGVRGNHYNQIGYNYHGKEAANNLFGVVYKRFEPATGVEMIDNDGLTRLDSGDSLELRVTQEYRLGALPLPHCVDEKLTWTSANELVATVDSLGVIRGVNPGNTVITVTTESGKTQSVNVSVYETLAEKVEYLWNFDDLTDSSGDNDLTLNTGNYSLTETGYKSLSASSDLTRADFALTTPIELNSSMDWSIEWKGYVQGGSTFLGQISGDPNSTDETKGHIYCSPYANWGTTASPKHAVKFKPDNGSQILLTFTEYKLAMTEMNCWKIEYSAEANAMKLWLSQDDGATWTETCSVTAGEFSLTADALFGRTRQDGLYNFNGEMDYIKVNCYKFTKVTAEDKIDITYRWDFNDLTDSVGGNDLTLNPACPANAATRYTIADGVYTVSKSTPDLERPDFVLDEAFTVDSESDWSIQWKGHSYWAGTLFGTSSEDTTTAADIPGGSAIYIAPTTNWGGSTPKYGIRFEYPGAVKYTLMPYTGYQELMTAHNSWRLSYDSETSLVSLLVSTDNGGSWELISQTKLTGFSMTFTNMFGRLLCNGKYNFIGEMDYVQVSLAK